MDYFSPCELTPAGTLKTAEGEFITASIDKTTIQTHDKKSTAYAKGLLNVTTHRIVWTDARRTRAIHANLSSLSGSSPTEDKSSPLRARVLLRYGRGVRINFESKTGARDRDRFVIAVNEACARKEWQRIAQQKAKEAAEREKMGDYVPRRAGVGGVQDRVRMQNAQRRDAINSGFASIDQLREQAEDLMKIAGLFRMKKDSSGEDNELLNMMAEMGIESPVTKELTGGNVAVYREQLSRQLSQFLRVAVVRVGGIMTLTDAYCLTMRNRASTELVSPEDFRAACEGFRRLKLGIEVKRLESGVLALWVDCSKDSSGAQSLLDMALKENSITALDVVRTRHIPIQRALAMLKEAEALGFLARDETTDGLRFFVNGFYHPVNNETKGDGPAADGGHLGRADLLRGLLADAENGGRGHLLEVDRSDELGKRGHGGRGGARRGAAGEEGGGEEEVNWRGGGGVYGEAGDVGWQSAQGGRRKGGEGCGSSRCGRGCVDAWTRGQGVRREVVVVK
ncbi:Vacuolar protein sorting protein [Gracilaria domingensis]|nr:Vacuolar protein sorting protein [Gracilaria domingensis]